MDRRKFFKQYFTPASVARFIFNVLRPEKNSKVIDPAAGDGAFIRAFSPLNFTNFTAVEIDPQASKLIFENYPDNINLHIITGNSLDPGLPLKLGKFDISVGNPPFSHQKYRVDDQQVLRHFHLSGNSQSIEILFLERFVQLTRQGGKIGIILPINIFSNSNLQYVRNYILSNIQIKGIIQLPRCTFSKTTARTAILIGNVNSQGHKDKVSLYYINSIDNFNDCSTLDNFEVESISQLQAVERMDPEYYHRKKIARDNISRFAINYKSLGELCTVSTGFRRYKQDSESIKTLTSSLKLPIRLISASDFDKLGFRQKEQPKFIEEKGPHFRPNACAFPGNVIFVRVGIGCIGRALMLMESDGRCQANDWCFVIKPEAVSPAILTAFLNSSIGNEFIKLESQGTGTISISKKRLMKIPVPIFSRNFSIKIDTYLKKVYFYYKTGNTKKAEKLFSDIDVLLKKEIQGEVSGRI